MRRNMEKFKSEEKEPEENGLEKLECFLEDISLELIENGIPVREDCRLNMDAFKEKKWGYRPEDIDSKKKRMEERKIQWDGGLPESERKKRSGEKLEMLKTAIFHKFLGDDFFVFRSSFYDDVTNKVDNIIIDKKSGDTVCAFDEIADEKGSAFEKKQRNVFLKNLRGGASLNYGVKVENNEEGNKDIILDTVENTPIFHLALSQETIEEGIKQFNPSSEKSEYEEKIFDYFINSIKTQISALQLNERSLNPELIKHLNSFEKKLKEIEE